MRDVGVEADLSTLFEKRKKYQKIRGKSRYCLMGKLHKNSDFTQFSRVFIENSLTNHADKFINRLVGVLKLEFLGG